MPKKKSSFYPQSQICGMGTDPVWDDTELVKQFDQALREWKQERKFSESVSDPEEIPGIGPWVSVEYDPIQLALQTQAPIPFIDDYEMISLYNEALSSWKVERKLKKVGESLSIYSNEDTPTKVICSPDEKIVQSSWTTVEPKNVDQTATKDKIKSSLPDDFEVIKLYNDALSSWKDKDGIRKIEQEQQHESENQQSQPNGQQISNGSLNSDTPEKSFKELTIQNGKNEENGFIENTKKENLLKTNNENSEIIEQSTN